MRSGELARITGVTVRALRHYHQVGVLDEPARAHNGYRAYTVRDVARVLRIKRMSALGIPLDRMRPLLDDPSADGTGLLAALDAELAAEIERLTVRRRLIADLRAEGAPPDAPPELAPFVALFADAYPTRELADFDRDQTALLAHLVGDSSMDGLADVYARISAPELMPTLLTIVSRFGSLTPDTPDDEVEAFARDYARTLTPLISAMSDIAESLNLKDPADLLGGYTAEVLNPAQRRVLDLVPGFLEV
ncbi:MerR family transcriptional regulator [Actinocorallia sp. A-T 12471]|uniref:MerR family transcriptional regulator n=1 Tax=Actinocorallia sp. A-T 12471 TaxID=3089813 RepID=UPI0029CE34A6|nr:MerR family transcriptional regulator [Actinocorallia sp. A-T 12471]MDX6742666.1 MerR family transcriptional regulator [Actinocorallia sp. A-T 12471]